MGRISSVLIRNETAPNEMPMPNPHASTLSDLFSLSFPYLSHSETIAEAPDVLPYRSSVIGIRSNAIRVFFAICFKIYKFA